MRKFNILLLVVVFLFSGFYFGEPAQASSKIVNPNQTYTYSEMVRDIGKLQKAYPDLIKVKVIGKSEYGRNIYAFSLGKGEATVFINGSHHAREWMTTNLNMYMAENYAIAYKKKQKIKGYEARKILDSTTIWFVPMVNPDGVTLQQSGLKAFPKKLHTSLIKMNEGSKNFTRWKANAKGVDLNRQYDAGWKAIKGPSSPRYKNFKGKAPHSAAETKAILKFVEEINPEMTVAYHSTGKILYWNYKQDKARYARDHVYAKKIGSLTGYRLIYPSPNPSGGGFTDWFVDKKKRPGFTPEISRAYYERNPPLSEFPGAWRENQAVGLYVAQESVKLFDARYKKKVDDLASDFKSLETQAKKLKNYYHTNITTTNDLKISSSFTTLYNKVTSDHKKLQLSAKKLPRKFQSKYSGYIKSVNYYLAKSDAYMKGIKDGEKLTSLNKNFVDKLSAGTLDSATVQSFKELSAFIPSTELAISKMYGVKVRALATEKYVTPVKQTIENSKIDIARFNLTTEIEVLVSNKNIVGAKEQLVNLDNLEAASKKLYPNVEKLLTDKKQQIILQIEQLEKEQKDTGETTEEITEETTVVE